MSFPQWPQHIVLPNILTHIKFGLIERMWQQVAFNIFCTRIADTAIIYWKCNIGWCYLDLSYIQIIRKEQEWLLIRSIFYDLPFSEENSSSASKELFVVSSNALFSAIPFLARLLLNLNTYPMILRGHPHILNDPRSLPPNATLHLFQRGKWKFLRVRIGQICHLHKLDP